MGKHDLIVITVLLLFTPVLAAEALPGLYNLTQRVQSLERNTANMLGTVNAFESKIPGIHATLERVDNHATKTADAVGNMYLLIIGSIGFIICVNVISINFLVGRKLKPVVIDEKHQPVKIEYEEEFLPENVSFKDLGIELEGDYTDEFKNIDKLKIELER